MEMDEPDTSSAAANEGTTAHDHAAQWLVTGMAGAALLEDAEMHAALRLYVEEIRSIVKEYVDAGAQVEVLVEQKLPLEEVTGERGAIGTADVVIGIRYADHGELHVIDLKYGRGVEVDDDTLQLPVYALAGVAKYGLMDDFTQVHTTIIQPRMGTVFNTLTYSIEELRAIGVDVLARAQEALRIVADGPATALGHLKVTEKGCRFCKAQSKCPAKARQIHDAVYGELQDLTTEGIIPIDETTHVGPQKDFAALLPLFMRRVPEIEAWCKYVRAKVEQLLIAGQQVDGFTLVQGRAGARAWTSQDAVLPVLAYAHVPREVVMVPPELRSPADLQKKLKAANYGDVWEHLVPFITQAPGKPSVAPVSDPRPAYAGAVFDGDSYDAGDLV